MSITKPISPSAFHIMAKPRGAVCNLDCRYCYYLPKEGLYPGSTFRMTEDTLEAYTAQYIAAHQINEVTFDWQGGEPTLMGLEFFQRALYFQRKYARPGMRIRNTLQTNGTLLDEDWCRFFKKHHFLIGISIDGPGQFHDAFRVDKGGKGSFEKVLRGWRSLQSLGVETNVLCSVHAANQDHPLDVYRFFRDEIKAQFIQFIPIVERRLGVMEKTVFKGWKRNIPSSSPTACEIHTGLSVNPHKLGKFLIAIFDEWVHHDVGKIFIQMFDTALGSWLGRPGGLCIFAPTCGTALALEHTGDLYSCDHFVKPEYLLGNIQHSPMSDLVVSEKQGRFGMSKHTSLPRYCLDCEVLFACNGGCPKDRIMKTPDGQPGLNYLCPGYKAFFNHITRPMKVMADLFRQGRSPADILSFATDKQPKRT